MTEQEIIEKYDRKLSDLQDKYLDLTNENYAEPTKPMEIANNGENLIYKYSAIVEYIVNKLESKDKEGVGVLIESNIQNYECYSGDAVFIKQQKNSSYQYDYNEAKKACKILSKELGYEVALISSLDKRGIDYVYTFAFANNKEELQDVTNHLKETKTIYPYAHRNRYGATEIIETYNGNKNAQSVKYLEDKGFMEKSKYARSLYDNMFRYHLKNIAKEKDTKILNPEQIEEKNKAGIDYQILKVHTINREEMHFALDTAQFHKAEDVKTAIMERNFENISHIDIIHSKGYMKDKPRMEVIEYITDEIRDTKKELNKELEEIRNTKQNKIENIQTNENKTNKKPKGKSR